MELKQLEYFIACADTGSFRKAAGILYTSQSNVSKVIQGLEKELGGALLHRTQTGVTLTDRGAAIYEHAKSTLASARRISRLSDDQGLRHLNILTNPSRWMARTFRRYYQAHGSSNVRYSVLTASTNDIIRALADGAADIGFAYVMEQQLSSLQAQLSKNHLTFAALARTGALLYQGKRYEPADVNEPIGLVQGYEDEFTLKSYWSSQGANDGKSPAFRVSVVTNSDRLMTEMLEHTGLCNMSCQPLGEDATPVPYEGKPLFQDEEPVIFGFICRADQKLKQEALEFLRFAKKTLA